jgi:magnesium transporter
VALLREMDPGEVGLAGRVKPVDRNPPRSVLFDAAGGRQVGVPMEGVAARLRAGDAFFFADLHAPDDQELDTLRKEFHFHPLAIEDVRTRHQRPKIDVYGDQYFLVFYRIGQTAGDGDWVLQEIDFFIGPNFLVVTHDSQVSALDATYERFCREEGKKEVSGLLYDILDAMVDEYFLFLDDLGERSQQIEDEIFEHYDQVHLERLLDLKKDLALLRRIAAPERDAVNVLLRRDPPILDTAHIFYFQDIYDHLIRIADSIDTYRELATGTLDAFLSVQNNRLSDVVRKLTVISIIFLPITAITGFFGMNFRAFDPANHLLFVVALTLIMAVPLLMVWLLRRKGLR